MDWLLFLPFGSAYFIPTLIAMRRHHRSTVTIAAVNIVLGWTILGWVIALTWALSHNTKESHARMLAELSKPGALSSYDSNRLPGL